MSGSSAFTMTMPALLLALAPNLLAAQLGVGTWVRTDSGGAQMTMTVESCCGGGFRLTYHVANVVMTVESPMNGRAVPVLIDGKPSGETMAIKRLDAYHAVTTMTMNGQSFGISRSTLSADGKTLTVEDDFTAAAGGHTGGKQTETWVRR